MTLALLNNESDNLDLDNALNLKTTDFENGLNVYQDNRKNWMYNMNTTVSLSVDEPLLREYTCTTDSFWPLISYNIYETSRLSWLLMNLNKVRKNDVFKPVLATLKVKYLDKSYIRSIIASLLNYDG